MQLIKILLLILFLTGPLLSCDCSGSQSEELCETTHTETDSENCSVFCNDGCCLNNFKTEIFMPAVPYSYFSAFASHITITRKTGHTDPIWQPPRNS